MKKKVLSLIVTGFVTIILTGCGASQAATSSSVSDSNTVIKVGTNITSHAETLEEARPILVKEGTTLEIVKLEDSITPNTGAIEGSLDANYSQHVPYLEQFNKENDSDLVPIGVIYYEPFGVYVGRVTKLSLLPDGALVAVPNNVINEVRIPLLLVQEGIIILNDDAGVNATVENITDNPKNIQFKESAPEQLVSVLPDVDIIVINGNYAIEGGLKISDVLAMESNDGLAAKTYANITVASPDKKDDEALKTLVEVLQSSEIKLFVEETYDGAVVPLD